MFGQEELSTAAPGVSGSTGEEEKEKVGECGGTFSREDRRLVGGAVERLGLKLLDQLPVSPQQPNVVLSPLSLAFALAHLTVGLSDSVSTSRRPSYLDV